MKFTKLHTWHYYRNNSNDELYYGFMAQGAGEHIDIGILRLHALLFVGKAGIKGRIYKVAVVPRDIREELVEILK